MMASTRNCPFPTEIRKMTEIVVNPAGASGRTLKVWKKIEPVFQKSGKEYHVHFSTLECGVTEIVKKLTSDHQDRDIVIVGGDGTMNQAVNGICDFQHTRVGFISCGSGNDLARGLKLPKDPETNVHTILEGNTVRMTDVGETVYLNRINELTKEKASEDGYVHRKFNISSGIGFDAAICQKAQIAPAKKTLNRIHLGKLIYLGVAIEIIATTKRTEAWISVDGKTEKYDQLLFTVAMNEPYEGGGFQFCPHADDHDGELDLCIGDKISKFDFYRIFPYAYKGNHLKFKGVYEKRGHAIEIRTAEPKWVHTDGEVTCMSSHIRIGVLPEKMKMLN